MSIELRTVFEFHVSRRARERYAFDQWLFTTSGNVIFANFLAAREFAQKMNAGRDLQRHPEQAVQAGMINALALIDEILHLLFRAYRQQYPNIWGDALTWLHTNVGEVELDKALRRFTEEFPPLAVYSGGQTVDEYLQGESVTLDGERLPNRHIALEEMVMLRLANENPAFQPFIELFDDAPLHRDSAYLQIFTSLQVFFETQPKFGPGNQNLLEMLRAPMRAYPDSLLAQLEFLGQRFAGLLKDVLLRVLSVMDMVKEETRPVFGGPGPAQVMEFAGTDYYDEPERFSPDLDWMPNLVLIAKNTYVWLDQLARKYQRPINRLDQVPVEELERLRRYGVTGLWLIGLWERSPASQRIKQMRGNAEAVASAYSLFSYDIAADLGGEEAYAELKRRAGRCGIRLASDMVPNHMGIDSRWLIEHPDWFVQAPYSPFPSYTFNGPNLSWDERVGIFLEDHYYNDTDAAVVFKRVDQWTGDTRFIYHGNDGTSMPWNDTAQLNYLLPEVREAVIQTILHVARKFPVIRFDAAMTLAKRHYHRLWYPEPGSGGDIASRSEHGLTKAQFDQAFPEEFWRMVVDRVAQEAPDTLLLAEAFWLMEGYFVRTLGMHRVYNSAFMNMLRDEKNQEYRLAIKNTLEFDPEVLKRYVNFMNNPDERTAVDQFGKGDKYFGVCLMLATLPGLPMIGHGQIEGFSEKYGMEFRYPKWHEDVDEYLVERHQREIFPLLRRRYLFANAYNFTLYDFYRADGGVAEDVFAYSNRYNDEKALVLYHNRFADVRGWIRQSAAFAVKTGQGDEKVLAQRTLSEALSLTDDPRAFTILPEQITGLEYLRPSAELVHKGLYVELNAYRYLAFHDIREVIDETGDIARLYQEIGMGGVLSVEDAVQELKLGPVLAPFRELVNAGMLNWLIDNRVEAENFGMMRYTQAIEEVHRKADTLAAEIVKELLQHSHAAPGTILAEETAAVEKEAAEIPAGDVVEAGAIDTIEVEASPAKPLDLQSQLHEQGRLLSRDIVEGVRTALNLGLLERDLQTRPAEFRQAYRYLAAGPHGNARLQQGKPEIWGTLIAGLIIAALGRPALEDERARLSFAEISRLRANNWLLTRQVETALNKMGVEPAVSERLHRLIPVLAGQQGWLELEAGPEQKARGLLEGWLSDPAAVKYLAVHLYDGQNYYNKEAFEELTWWTCALEVVRVLAGHPVDEIDAEKVRQMDMRQAYKVAQALLKAMVLSEYKVEKLLD